MNEKIYILHLDTSFVHVPVDAIKITANQYRLIDNNNEEFEFPDDPLYLFEFYPGDEVAVEERKFNDGRIGLIATRLIKAGQWPDRRFKEFKFKATQGTIPLNRQSADFYSEEIQRILVDQKSGEKFYKETLETVKKLRDTITN